MGNTYQKLIDTLETNDKVKNFRTAAHVVPISKIARPYFDLGAY
jgi:hypothetical protein